MFRCFLDRGDWPWGAENSGLASGPGAVLYESVCYSGSAVVINYSPSASLAGDNIIKAV